MTLICSVCQTEFERNGTRGPMPKYCSSHCKSKALRQSGDRKTYEREYRRAQRAAGRLSAYEFDYNRRPEVKARERQRKFIKWHTDPEWRRREILRMRSTIYPEIVVPTPYSGHRWLEMAREVTGLRKVDQTAPWADDYNDDTGEAVLALLEGRDMREAVRAYRSQEFPYRKLNIHMGDWKDDDGHDRFFDKMMPIVQSAEDEYLDNNPEPEYYVETRFDDVRTHRRNMHHATSQPSNRKSNRR